MDDSEPEEAPDLIKETGLGPTDGIEWSVWQEQHQPPATDDVIMQETSDSWKQATNVPWMNNMRPSIRGGNNIGIVDPTKPIVRSDGTYVEDIQGGISDDLESATTTLDQRIALFSVMTAAARRTETST